MSRRRFLGLGVGLLGLGRVDLRRFLSGQSKVSSAGPDQADPPIAPLDQVQDPKRYALRDTVPGFRAVGAWTGSGPAPVLVQLMLNINDFMRPDMEAAAVTRWLDLAQARKLWPMELSFTGHVLQAFVDHAPDLVARIRSTQPTITEHYRLLRGKRLDDTEHELYYTDPATLRLDRSRFGPAVLIQKTFGVTPRDEGGALCALLRQRWVQGPRAQELRALGFDHLQRKDQIGHPDRIVAMSLPDPGPTDPHRHVEAYLRLRRLQDALLAGRTVGPVDLDDLYRFAQWAHEQGFDVSAVPGLGDLVDISGLPDFIAGFAGLHAPSSSQDAWQVRLDTDVGATDALLSAMRGLAERTATLPSIQAELAFKLSRLDDQQVYLSRLAWHASNDYTAEAWGDHMAVPKGQIPLPLTPASSRSIAQQTAIQAAALSILDTLAASARVQVASLDGDTQWLAENSPEAQYPDVLGVNLDRVPDSLSATAIDAQARAAGIVVKPPGRRGPHAGGHGGGQAGGRGGGGRRY